MQYLQLCSYLFHIFYVLPCSCSHWCAAMQLSCTGLPHCGAAAAGHGPNHSSITGACPHQNVSSVPSTQSPRKRQWSAAAAVTLLQGAGKQCKPGDDLRQVLFWQVLKAVTTIISTGPAALSRQYSSLHGQQVTIQVQSECEKSPPARWHHGLGSFAPARAGCRQPS